MTLSGSPVQQPSAPVGAHRARPVTGDTPGRRLRVHGDSRLWPAAAAAVFTLVVLLSGQLRMGLRSDEAIYASQISQHLPIMPWAPARARGLPLLIAPVTLAGGPAYALRCYLAVLAGIALLIALLAWRGTRPGWQL